MTHVSIELSLDQLADELSSWSYEDLLELLKTVDERKSEWDFISHIKSWVDVEHRKMVQEETEDKAEREDRCTRSKVYPDIWVHVSPHKGCILR